MSERWRPDDKDETALTLDSSRNRAGDDFDSSRPLPGATPGYGERRLVESASRLASDTARWSTRAALFPLFALPRSVRRAVYESFRLTAEGLALMPRAFLETLEGIVDEVEDAEEKGAGREDLGSRLRRELRGNGSSGSYVRRP